VQRPVPIPPPTNGPSSGWPLPPKAGRTILLGIAMVSTGFALFFANLQRRQAKKERKDIVSPGSLPTWQYRMKQAGQPEDDSDHPLTLRQSRHAQRDPPLASLVRDHHNGHSTISDYLASANFSEEGRRMQPTPQRSRGDGSGRVYTKSPSWNDSYEKTEKHHKRMKVNEKTRLAEDEDV